MSARSPRSLVLALVEVAVIAAIAVVVSQLIRLHALEWYLVPSASMEPTLHGDPRHGDVVLVDKTAFARRAPRLFDLVVLHNPDDPVHSHLIKRVVACGDDERSVVRVVRGDLFSGASPQSLERVVKDPAAARAMRMTHYAFPDARDRPVEQYFRPSAAWSAGAADAAPPFLWLEPAQADLAGLAATMLPEQQRARRAANPPDLYLPGHLSTALPVNTTFLDSAGQRRGAFELYRDIGIEVEAELEPGCEGLQLVLEHRGRYLAFAWTPAGRGMLLADGERAAEVEGKLGAPHGARARLAFGYLDGAVFAEAQGEIVLHRVWALPEDDDLGSLSSPVMHNLLHIGAAGAGARLHRVRVFHDVYYKALESPFGASVDATFVPPGHLFLLGDNTFESRDSRAGRTFPRSDLVGSPIAVLAPARRARWLRRRSGAIAGARCPRLPAASARRRLASHG